MQVDLQRSYQLELVNKAAKSFLNCQWDEWDKAYKKDDIPLDQISLRARVHSIRANGVHPRGAAHFHCCLFEQHQALGSKSNATVEFLQLSDLALQMLICPCPVCCAEFAPRLKKEYGTNCASAFVLLMVQKLSLALLAMLAHHHD